MKVLIAGASGLIGRALSQQLSAHQHLVHSLVRRPPASATEIEWHPEHADLDPDVLRGFDAVVCLSGAGIGDRRWTQAYKRELVESRLESTGTLARALAALPPMHRPATFLSGSAVGYYGERGDQPLVESAAPGTGFLANLVVRWEAATEPAAAAGIRVVTLRTGLVLAPGGGLLQRLVPLFRLGLGGKLGSGEQYQSWISLADEAGAIRHLLESGEVSGPVNLAAPNPVRNTEFTVELARQLHRPAPWSVPAFALRLALGEFADEGVLVSQRAVPETLLASGYEFGHPKLPDALGWALAG